MREGLKKSEKTSKFKKKLHADINDVSKYLKKKECLLFLLKSCDGFTFIYLKSHICFTLKLYNLSKC